MKKIFFFAVAALFCATSLCLADDCNTPTISAATITFTYQEMPPLGVTSVKAKFMVSATKCVFFSQGNLEYQPSTNSYKFYDHQWELTATGNKYATGQYADPRANLIGSNWIDLFPWGNPSNPTSDQAASSFSDWGNKSIQNTDESGWHTLSSSEWQYLFNNHQHAGGNVHGTYGLILLPINWEMPACGFTMNLNSNSNSPTNDQWQSMEEAGAIFLPACGYIVAKNTNHTQNAGVHTYTYTISSRGSVGYYWDTYSTGSGSNLKTGYVAASGYSSTEITDTYASQKYLCGVRLVLTTTAPEQ